MKVRSFLSTVSHRVHHSADTTESEVNLQLDSEPGLTQITKKKGHPRKHLHEAEYKSKWDQFCDFTSLNGFRLLSSKFSITLRIATASVMVIATLGLCWNLSGAFDKYFSPSGQKDSVTHQGESEPLKIPKLIFCQQSKNSRSSIHPNASGLLTEDSRRVLHLYYTEELDSKHLKNRKLPHPQNMNGTIDSQNCVADFYQMQNLCVGSYYEKYCSIFRSPLNLTDYDKLNTGNYDVFFEFKLDYDDCLTKIYMNESYNLHSEESEKFYCCRLQKAYDYFKAADREDFQSFVNFQNQQDIVLWTSAKNYTAYPTQNGLYGGCEVYDLDHYITDTSIDGKPLYTVDFLLDTISYDTIIDSGVLVFMVTDNYRTNEYLLLPNAHTTIIVKDMLDITDTDCSSDYPDICSDALQPYSDRICDECYTARKYCDCNNPLKNSINFNYTKPRTCTVAESLLCLLQKPSSNLLETCSEPCTSKYFKTLRTMDNLNLTATMLSLDETEKVLERYKNAMKNLAITIDTTSIPFLPGNHVLWESVDVLIEIFDTFLEILLIMIKLSDKTFPLIKNVTQILDDFAKFEARFSPFGTLVQNYHNFVHQELENANDQLELARSIHANILMKTIPNPPRILNYYKQTQNLETFIRALTTLKHDTTTALKQANLRDDHRQLLVRLQEILRYTNETPQELQLIKAFKAYLDEFDIYFTDNYAKSLARLTLSFTTKVVSKIVYSRSYTFWNFLSDVGGIMGLYFGLTMVTLYEMITFGFIDREPPEAFNKKEKKLTRKTLYPKILLSDEPIPSIY